MNEPDIDYCIHCGRPDYLWESTGCDVCAATVRAFELVGGVSTAQGWQGSPRLSEAQRLRALWFLKAREMRNRLGRWVTQAEMVEALRASADPAAPQAQTSGSMIALSQINVGRRLADYYRGLMNAG